MNLTKECQVDHLGNTLETLSITTPTPATTCSPAAVGATHRKFPVRYINSVGRGGLFVLTLRYPSIYHGVGHLEKPIYYHLQTTYLARNPTFNADAERFLRNFFSQTHLTTWSCFIRLSIVNSVLLPPYDHLLHLHSELQPKVTTS